MSDQHPGFPQNPNGPLEKQPHAGQLPQEHGREVPHVESDTPLDQAGPALTAPESAAALGPLSDDEKAMLESYRAKKQAETSPKKNKWLNPKRLIATGVLTAVGIAGAAGIGVKALGGGENPNPDQAAAGPAVPGKDKPEASDKGKEVVHAPTLENSLTTEDFKPHVADDEMINALKQIYIKDKDRAPIGATKAIDLLGYEAAESLDEGRIEDAREAAYKFFSDEARLQQIINDTNEHQGTDLSIEDTFFEKSDLELEPGAVAARVNNVNAALAHIAAELEFQAQQNTNGGDADENALVANDVYKMINLLDTGRGYQESLTTAILSAAPLGPKAGEIAPDTAVLTSSIMAEIPDSTHDKKISVPVLAIYGKAEIAAFENSGMGVYKPVLNTYIAVPLSGMGGEKGVPEVIKNRAGTDKEVYLTPVAKRLFLQ